MMNTTVAVRATARMTRQVEMNNIYMVELLSLEVGTMAWSIIMGTTCCIAVERGRQKNMYQNICRKMKTLEVSLVSCLHSVSLS